MRRKFDLKNLEADKIALLGLFVLALLIAYFIVSVKSAVVFSEPIELAHTGLSISVPIGNGWQSEKKWQYQHNGYTLSSSFTAGSDRPTAWVYCRYMLAAEAISPQKWFELKAAEIDGTIVKVNQERINALMIDWVHIEKPELLFDTFLGAVELPDNRRLNIEVSHQMTSEIGLAEKVFRQIVGSMNFEDNRLLNAGIEIVTAVKNRGIGGFLENQNRQTYFLIKDEGQQTVGFMIDILVDSERDAPFNIQAAGHIYGQRLTEQATLFRCKNNLDEFVWQSETNNDSGRNHIEIILSKMGSLEIVDSQAKTRIEYAVGPAAIPDIFLEQVLFQMLENNVQKIIVDIINAEGKVIPTLVSVVGDAENIAAGKDFVYAFKLDFLDGRGFFQTVYLNGNRQIAGATIQQKDRFILESTNIETIESQFPERADFVSQRNRMLK